MTDSQMDSQPSEKEVLQEERYLWMARAFSLIALLAFVANILMLLALSGLTPLLRVQPFYLKSQSKDYQVISIVRPSMDELNVDVLQESLIREYLLARYGITSDVSEVEKRWGIEGAVFAMSASSVYKDFFEKEAIPMLEQAEKDGLTWNPRINNVIRKRTNPDVWDAELEIQEMSQISSDQLIRKFKVKLEVVFQPTNQQMSWGQRLKNPLGFTVTRFERKEEGENQ